MGWLVHALQSMSGLQLGVIFLFSLVAAGWDTVSRRIPNILTFPMIVTGLIWSAYSYGITGFLGSLAACIILALPYVLLFVSAGGGGGDVKMMAGIGAWAGLLPGLVFLVAISVSGVVVATMFAIFRGQLRPVMTRVAGVAYQVMPSLAQGPRGLSQLPSNLAIGEAAKSQPMPYGIAIFSGVCLVAAGRFLWQS